MKNDIETANRFWRKMYPKDYGDIAEAMVAYADQFIPKESILKQIIARIEQYEVNRSSPHSTIDDIKLILAGYKQPDK
jgi:hypothetical protein